MMTPVRAAGSGPLFRAFYCPTRRTPKRNQGNLTFPAGSAGGARCGNNTASGSAISSTAPSVDPNIANMSPGQSDYAASIGSNDSFGGSGMEGATIHLACQDGRLPIGIQNIIDGTANTILYGEKNLNLRNLGMQQGNDNEGWATGWDQDVLAYSANRPMPDQVNANWPERFGSSHPASFNVVMCDGAVKSISYRIDATPVPGADVNNHPLAGGTLGTTTGPNRSLLNRLGTRNDGLPVESPN
jgi:hypothetical protein